MKLCAGPKLVLPDLVLFKASWPVPRLPQRDSREITVSQPALTHAFPDRLDGPDENLARWVDAKIKNKNVIYVVA